MASPLADLLGALDRAFTATSTPWYLFGAQAAVLHGVARFTADVDVTVALGSCPIDRLVSQLRDEGFVLRVSSADEFVARTRVLPFRHDRTRIPVDVVLAGPGIEELFFQRCARHDIEGQPVPVAAVDDLVAMKILAGRAKDIEDAAALLRIHRHTLDLQRLRKTLRQLERALDQSDLLPELDRLLRE